MLADEEPWDERDPTSGYGLGESRDADDASRCRLGDQAHRGEGAISGFHHCTEPAQLLEIRAGYHRTGESSSGS